MSGVSGKDGSLSRFARLWLFCVFNYALLLWTVLRFVWGAPPRGGLAWLLLVTEGLSSPALYLIVAFAPLAGAALLWSGASAWLRRRSGRGELSRLGHGLVALYAVGVASALQLLLYADLRIWQLFGFHLNGFVLNLVTTEGGIASLGATRAAFVWTCVGVLSLVLAESGLWVSIGRVRGLREIARRLSRRRAVATLAIGLVALVTLDKLAYGIGDLRAQPEIQQTASIVPFYVPVTFKGLALDLGYVRPSRPEVHLDPISSQLDYPLQALHRQRGAPTYNLVWLVAESLRADALTPDVMPTTWAFRSRSIWFRDHFSGGNGTRMGIFSMFYGLPGPYWFAFLREGRGPVLIDALNASGFQIQAFTSDDFSYPELSRTVFSQVPPSQLHEYRSAAGPGWQRDRIQISALLDWLASDRDPSRPFFVFSFLESPHAPYTFPPESVVRRPYTPEANYLTLDPSRDVEGFRNRYLNSVRHLDSQIARVLEFLDAHGLLDSTLVVITGDHGEEFLEQGRWGHNSAFSDPQLRVPLLIHVPRQTARAVETPTSHLDLPATLLSLLGYDTPPEAYSGGVDLLHAPPRETWLASDWTSVGLVDARVRLRIPMTWTHLARFEVRTRAGEPVQPATDAVRERSRPIAELMRLLARFHRHAGSSSDSRRVAQEAP
ncbi:MAG: sulfatase-like hydrolase/transferase [Myxococcota bacterium]